MTRAPNTNFAKVWYVQSLLVLIAALPLGILGWVPEWPLYMSYLVTLGLGWFGSAEWAAEVTNDTPQSDSGTYTSFLFWKIDGRWGRVGRVLYGAAIGAVLYWRLPDIWYLDDAIWVFFQTWLPYHYWSPGIRGPWEWLGAFIFRR
ncbi:MAG: hypothetical protein GWN18_00735 [Thermoplasmata archaeon]|nr:hypothetical protein [Thermoplasmata archaeon]NIS18482.1 hypothetical protein [Thermoplasmata archaeon]NIT75470.1 hypothetical protein [Thermoplasmata archaeon]NIU47638.1 hypothetical protein [Thermoplasmata archaeon]NIV77295.1 hypothetical protein [Thermoplasmata archaeon]